MGLGGYLAWTAVAREIHKATKYTDFKFLPYEGTRNKIVKEIKNEIFKNNPYFRNPDEEIRTFPLWLNNPEANYCSADTPQRAIHRHDRHIIEQMCAFYGIYNPELRCELYFTDDEEERVAELIKNLNSNFIVIEPHSKMNYTPNRIYPWEKWQNFVNTVSKHTQIVQVGANESRVLDNVTNLTGQTSFREAACLIGKSNLFVSTEGGLVHAATAVDTTSLVIITGYQHPKMVSYSQNINMNISSHGPCGLKIECQKCQDDASKHEEDELIQKALDFLDEDSIH